MDTPGRPQSRPSKQWRPATTGGRTRGLSDSTHIDDILGVEDERPRHAGAHHAAGVLVAPHQDPVCGGVECGFRGRGSACWCVRACLAVVQCGAGDDGPCILPWPRACPSLAPHPPTSQTHPTTYTPKRTRGSSRSPPSPWSRLHAPDPTPRVAPCPTPPRLLVTTRAAMQVLRRWLLEPLLGRPAGGVLRPALWRDRGCLEGVLD